MNSRRESAGSRSRNAGENYSRWMAIAFLVFVFALGGTGRSDAASLPFLRGGSLLFSFWAMLNMQGEDWQRVRVPLLLLFFLTIWICVQIIPLPPELWQALPGREVIVSIDRLLGQPDIWRPISLTPSQTANSLLSMTVPFAALLVVAQADAAEYPKLLFTIVAIACVSAGLGLVQIFSGAESISYLYRITSTEAMVGLFANRNHHAVFLACCVPIVAMLLRDELMRKRQRGTSRSLLALATMGLAAMTALIGSRVGLVGGVLASALSYAMIVSAWRAGSNSRASAGSARMPTAARAVLFVPPLLMAAMLGLVLWFSSRTTGFSRLIEQDVAADLRLQAWPTVEAMIAKFWVVGSGFGSFPDVYKMFEPDKLLQPSYFNRAHNDWAEVAMTGGLPAILILISATIWVSRGALARGNRNLVKGFRGDIRLPALTALFLLALASLFDYPLRIPSIQVFAIVLIILLCRPKQAVAVRD